MTWSLSTQTALYNKDEHLSIMIGPSIQVHSTRSLGTVTSLNN